MYILCWINRHIKIKIIKYLIDVWYLLTMEVGTKHQNTHLTALIDVVRVRGVGESRSKSR